MLPNIWGTVPFARPRAATFKEHASGKASRPRWRAPWPGDKWAEDGRLALLPGKRRHCGRRHLKLASEYASSRSHGRVETRTAYLTEAPTWPPTGWPSQGRFMGLVSKTGYAVNTMVCNALISMYGSCSFLANMYAKCGAIINAPRVFQLMEERDRISWNTIISAFDQNSNCAWRGSNNALLSDETRFHKAPKTLQ
jgi:hypothetical protein